MLLTCGDWFSNVLSGAQERTALFICLGLTISIIPAKFFLSSDLEKLGHVPTHERDICPGSKLAPKPKKCK
jgi:hypothetical protein